MQGLDSFLSNLRLGQAQGVGVEIDHFAPEGWSWAAEADGFYVTGPWSKRWSLQVKELALVLAYAEGCVLRRVSRHRRELYTWRNPSGDGFKVVFIADVDNSE